MGNDLAHRKSLALENPHGELPPRDEPLDHHLVVIASRELQRVRDSRSLAYDRQTNCGALFVGFHHHRPAESFADVVLENGGHEPIRRRHAGGAKQTLGKILVHRGRTGDVIAAGVGHAGEIQHRLHPTVLSRSTMEREKDDIDVAYIRGVTRQSKRRLTHIRQGSGRWRHRPDTAGEQLFLGIRGEASRDGVDCYDVVTEAA